MLDFFGLILSEDFCIWKEARISKKYIIIVQKNSLSQGGLTVITRFLKYREI